MLFRDQNKAYRGLGLAHKNLGNLQEALVSNFYVFLKSIHNQEKSNSFDLLMVVKI